jgi:hypothetical protein
MLPVFCCQICLSVLLIGMVEPLKDREPIVSVLVIGQLLSACLLGWLFEWISRSKNSTGTAESFCDSPEGFNGRKLISSLAQVDKSGADVHSLARKKRYLTRINSRFLSSFRDRLGLPINSTEMGPKMNQRWYY